MSAKVRDAVVDDAAGIARVHVESSDDAYAPLAEAWEPTSVADRTRDWQEWLTLGRRDPSRIDLVAEADGTIVGFVTVGSSRARHVDAELEVYVLHVLPSHRGRGIGGALWTEACRRTRGAGLRSICVETFAELRCCRFYEAFGGEVVFREATTFFGGRTTEVVYAWPVGRASTVRSA